ncbi:putative ribonuclease H-like domain-containing protein [Tanacetum coccineum]
MVLMVERNRGEHLIGRFAGRGNKPDPRDMKITSLKQRIQELEFPQLQQDSLAEEAETKSNVWDDRLEDVNPFCWELNVFILSTAKSRVSTAQVITASINKLVLLEENYALWDVIENENSFKPAAKSTTNIDGTSTTLIPGPVTTEENVQKKNDMKARSMLLMTLPNEHLITFNQYKDAMTLFAAIQTRFGGFRRLNKPDLDTMSFDVMISTTISRLLNERLKELQAQAQAQILRTSLLFSTASTQVSTANLSDTTVYAFLANQPNGSQLIHKDLENIHEDNLEEMDLKWQLALLSMRTRRFFQKTGRKITINGSDIAGYDKSKEQDSRHRNQDRSRRTINVEETSSKAMVAIDGAGFDWSYMADDEVPLNMVLMDFSNSEFNKSEFNLAAYKRGVASVEEQLVFYKKNEGLDKLIGSQITDKNRKGVGFVSYNAVPPPLTGLFSPPKHNLSNSSLEEFQQPKFEGYGPKTSKSVSEDISNEVRESPNAPLVKDLMSDDKLEKKTIFPIIDKIEFVRPKQQEKLVKKPVKHAKMYSFDHVKAHCNYHQKERVVSENNYTRVNYNYSAKKAHPSAHRNMAPKAVLMKTGLRPINIARPVNTAHPKTIVYSAIPMSHFSKSTQSTVNRPYQIRTTLTNKNFSQKVNTAKGKFYTARPNSAVVNAVRANQVNAVKASTCWVWRPTKLNSASITLKRHNYVDAQGRSKLGTCPISQTLRNLMEDMLPLGEEPKEGKLLVKELLKLMCDKKNNVLFTDIGCFVLSPDFKLADESQNSVLVVKPHNKTPYELFKGRTPALSFMRPFGCHVTILNTLDYLGEFDGKSDEGFFVGYSINSKDFRVQTLMILQNVSNDEPQPSSDAEKKDDEGLNKESGIDDQEKPKNITTAPLKATHADFFGDETEIDMSNITSIYLVPSTLNTRIHKDYSLDHVIGGVQFGVQTRRMTKTINEQGFISAVYEGKTYEDLHTCLFACFLSQEEPKKVIQALKDPSWIEAMQEELLLFKLQQVWTLVDLPHGKKAIGTKWVYRNKKDERGIVIRNKARLVVQGYTKEEGIDYDEIEEEVYVYQPPGFEDPEFPDRVYNVEKALHGLHQAPRAWYETLSTYLLDNGFQRGQIDKTLFIKRVKSDILLKFQMSSMGELTFFLRLQVSQKDDGIFISQDKYVDEILKKFGFSTMKTASTPMEISKPLMKDENAEDVDVHLYKSMISSLRYLTSSSPDIMFVICACGRFQVTPKVSHLHAVKRIFRYLKGQPKLGMWYPKDSPFDLEAYTDSNYVGVSLDKKSTIGGCQFLRSRLISWQCKKQTVVANSTTEAEYVAPASCCGQVLWIQNQMLDYGYNFMNTKIFNDNESTICIGKNPVFHSKTKHIEIRHYFIRDSNEKKLIQMIKIYTDQNGTDLLTKAFDLWATNKAKTINGEVQIQALVDGKNVIVTETSVRRDLQLKDAEGTECLPNATIFEQLTFMGAKNTTWNEFSSTMALAVICLATNQIFNFSKYIFDNMVKNLEGGVKFLMYPRFVQVFLDKQVEGITKHKEIYVTPSHTKKVFANMKREGKGFSRRVTPLFQTMMVQAPEELGEGSEIPTDPQHKPTIIQPSTSQPQKKQPRRKQRKDIEVPQPSSSTELITDEVANEEHIPTNSNDPLLGGLGAQDDASKQGRKIANFDVDAEVTLVDEAQGRNDDNLMFDTRVFDEQEVEVEKVVSTAEVTTVSATTTIVNELTLAQTLIEIKAAKPKAVTTTATTTATAITRPTARGVVVQEPNADYELPARLQVQEQEELTIEEKSKLFVELIDKRKKHFARLRAEEQIRKPPTKAQKRNQMCTYLKNMAGFNDSQLKNKSFDEVQKAFDKTMGWIDSFVSMDSKVIKGGKGKDEGSVTRVEESSSKRAGTKLEQERIKKQKIDDDQEEVEMKKHMEIVVDEE